MRLHKCSKVEKHLLENNLIDERRIWCYAQMKVCVSSQKVYGLVLVCVRDGELFIYNSEYNSTKLVLFYSCNISDMQGIITKKKLLATEFCFVNGEDNFRLDMDDWNRFLCVFE